MDAYALINELANSPLVRAEIPLEMQLGLPWLEINGGELCIRFKPHREDGKDGKILYFPPLYEIAWIYPFRHLVSFERKFCDAAAPLHEHSADWMMNIGMHYIAELYEACAHVLSFREEHGFVNDVVIGKYRKQYEETVRKLGLQELYL